MIGRIEEKMGRDSNNRLKIWRASAIKKAMPRTALRRSKQAYQTDNGFW